jgi:hypothetical protein
MLILRIGLFLTILTLTVTSDGLAQKKSDELVSRVDHLVYVTPDFNRGIEEIEKLLGVRATPGGQQIGRGTRNALVALGPNAYLEILGPDPEQPSPKEPRPFGLDVLKESKLIAWFIKGSDLERLRSEAVGKGVPLGEIKSGSRRQTEGVQLSWKFTAPWMPVADGIVPFFIDWGDSPHPAVSAAKGASLVKLRAEHPEKKSVRRMLQQLKLDLPVKSGKSPALIAVIDSPRGRVELR